MSRSSCHLSCHNASISSLKSMKSFENTETQDMNGKKSAACYVNAQWGCNLRRALAIVQEIDEGMMQARGAIDHTSARTEAAEGEGG